MPQLLISARQPDPILRPQPDVVIHRYRELVDRRQSINDLVTIVEGPIELTPHNCIDELIYL